MPVAVHRGLIVVQVVVVVVVVVVVGVVVVVVAVDVQDAMAVAVAGVVDAATGKRAGVERGDERVAGVELGDDGTRLFCCVDIRIWFEAACRHLY